MTSSSLLDTKPILVMTYKTKSILLLNYTHLIKYCQKCAMVLEVDLSNTNGLRASWTRIIFIFCQANFKTFSMIFHSGALKNHQKWYKYDEKPCSSCIQPISRIDFGSQKLDFRDPVHHWLCYRSWKRKVKTMTHYGINVEHYECAWNQVMQKIVIVWHKKCGV